MIWLPAVSTAPVAQGASICTGWTSTRLPPTSIRVYRTSGPNAGTVQVVDFKSYVGVVLAAEWPSTWPAASLESGAVAVKEYAWYYAMSWRGGTGTGGCYDVIDNTNDQIYWPESRSPTPGETAAIEATWYESITRVGSIILTGYRSGSDVGCGSDADGYNLYQRSARNCAAAGMTADQILQIYYGPRLAIWKPPAQPTAVFESPGFGETVTATSSATAAWTEETAAGSSITARTVALQMAAPIAGSCVVERWLPASPPWTTTGTSPQTVSGLKAGYCYRFVVGLTNSLAATTRVASGPMLVDPAAPVAAFSSPASGTATAFSDASTTVQWTETPASGTSIASRTLTEEHALQTMPGSCAGAQWTTGSSTSAGSGVGVGGLAHLYCYRWRLALVDSAGHSGTWLSGVLVEPGT
jgi:hypothetical protein